MTKLSIIFFKASIINPRYFVSAEFRIRSMAKFRIAE